jgi:hypothetical protein
MNSPSPLSFYINSNFANYFSRFNAQLPALPPGTDHP